MSQATFLDILIQLEVCKRIVIFGPKIDFFEGVSQGFLVKNDQILKSAFFTGVSQNSVGNHF